MRTASNSRPVGRFSRFVAGVKPNIGKQACRNSLMFGVFLVTAWQLGFGVANVLADGVTLSPAIFEEQANGASQTWAPTSGQEDLLGSSCTITPGGCQTSEAHTVEYGIIAQADGVTSGQATAEAQAGITYQFVVTGTNQPVPLIITGLVSAGVDGPDASAEGEITYLDSTFVPQNFEAIASSNGTMNTGAQSGNLFAEFNQVPGIVGTVTIYATCTTATLVGGGSTCNAAADPYISIDPTFLAENPGVTLELSSGIEQVAPSSSGGTTPPTSAPEPGTLALIGFAVPVIGAARSLRRRFC